MKDVREEYHAEGLSEANLHTDPLEQARRWVDEAIEAGLPLPNASFNISVACMQPMMPGSTPSTPPSAQLGTIPGGGGSGYRQR